MKDTINFLKAGLLLLFVFLFWQCESPCTRTVSQSKINAVNQTQLQSDVEAIDAYLLNNALTAIEDPTGIRYTINTQGTGSKPCIENAISVTYKGRLMSNGSQFDASVVPVSFPLNQLILGWQIILPKVQRGSKITLYIPSGFGYGATGSGSSIPANANLIFEIDLL